MRGRNPQLPLKLPAGCTVTPITVCWTLSNSTSAKGLSRFEPRIKSRVGVKEMVSELQMEQH